VKGRTKAMSRVKEESFVIMMVVRGGDCSIALLDNICNAIIICATIYENEVSS
jgi:hypothetical protein